MRVKQKTSQKLDRKKNAIVQPVRASNQGDLVDRFVMPRTFSGGGSIDSQVAMLKGMNRAQRHAMLTRMSTLHGNRHVTRVVARLRQNVLRPQEPLSGTTSQSSEHAAPTTSTQKGQPITASPSPSAAQTSLRPDSSPLLQAKLTLNDPDDQYEQEADQVANAVMRMSAPAPSPDEEHDANPIQPKLTISPKRTRADSSGEVSSDVESRINGLKGGGQPLPKSERHFFESRMGADFSGVRIHTDTNAAQISRDINARAFTVGNNIAFNGGEYAPGSQGGRHLLAHELTHTIQQGAAGQVQLQPAGIQTFAPGSHRSATVKGLAESFSAEEIGAIYQSNWERDFSQGPPEIADMVIAWKQVKMSAAKNGGNPSPDAGGTFRDKMWTVIDMNLMDSIDESLSGYYSWEHMDNPGEGFWSNPKKEADKRWKDNADGLPGYINDSKAYIKDQIVAAVDQYRSFMDKGELGGGIDNWNGVEKPKGYDPEAIANAAWIGDQDSPSLERNIIAEETEKQARKSKAHSKKQADWEKTLWQVIGHHLGRSMHAMEDFFAHSNWLELAKLHKHKGSTSSLSVQTGTFEMPDKAHALGHKLVALSSQLLQDFELLLKIYERTEASTKLNPKDRGNFLTDQNMNDFTFGPLETDSWTPVGEMLDIGIVADNMEEMVQSGRYEVADFLLNKEWLNALRKKGQILIEEGDKEAPEDGHGKLAKDQPEHGKDYAQAQELAIKANEMVFGPLRKIMDMGDVKAAKEALIKQLEMVDQMIAMPSASHPLIRMVEIDTDSESYDSH